VQVVDAAAGPRVPAPGWRVAAAPAQVARWLAAGLLLSAVLPLVALVDLRAAAAAPASGPALPTGAGTPTPAVHGPAAQAPAGLAGAANPYSGYLDARFAALEALWAVESASPPAGLPATGAGEPQPGGPGSLAPPLAWALSRRDLDLAAAGRSAQPDGRGGDDPAGEPPAPSRPSVPPPRAVETGEGVVPRGLQPVLYALFNRAGGRLALTTYNVELPAALVIDVLTQALLRRTDLDDPAANAALHALLTTGLIYGLHHVDQALLRRRPPPLRTLLGGWPEGGGWHLRNPSMLALISAAQIVAVGPTRRLLQDHGLLPTPVGITGDGRPEWADPSDYWPNLAYDVGVHGLSTGLLTATLGRATHLVPVDVVMRAKEIMFQLGAMRSDRAWEMSAWRLGVVTGLLAASARAVSTMATERPPDGAVPPALPAWAQPFTYALANRLGQSVMSQGLAGRGELPLLLAIDAATQALLGRTDAGDPLVDAALHVAAITGLIYAAHHGSEAAYRSLYRSLERLRRNLSESSPPRPLPFPLRPVWSRMNRYRSWLTTRGAHPPHDTPFTPRNPAMLAATAASQLLAEDVGKRLLRDLRVLPAPVGTRDGRPQWATVGGYTADLLYDAGVHGLSTGLLMALMSRRSHQVPLGSILEAPEFRSQMVPLWLSSAWKLGLITGVISAGAKAASELAGNPPDGGSLRDAALGLQALDRLRLTPPPDGFWTLLASWLLNDGEAAITWLLDVVQRNLFDVQLLAERVGLLAKVVMADVAGDHAESWRLQQDPAFHGRSPEGRAAAQAAWARSERALRAVVAFPEPRDPVQRALRLGLNVVDLGANWLDVAVARYWAAPPDAAPREERAAAAFERAGENVRRIDEDAAALSASLRGVPAAVRTAIVDATAPPVVAAAPPAHGLPPAHGQPVAAAVEPASLTGPVPTGLDAGRSPPTEQPAAARTDLLPAERPAAAQVTGPLVTQPPAGDRSGTEGDDGAGGQEDPGAGTAGITVTWLETEVDGVVVRKHGDGRLVQVIDGRERPHTGPDPFGTVSAPLPATAPAGADQPTTAEGEPDLPAAGEGEPGFPAAGEGEPVAPLAGDGAIDDAGDGDGGPG
jgi:hypothetical protein